MREGCRDPGGRPDHGAVDRPSRNRSLSRPLSSRSSARFSCMLDELKGPLRRSVESPQTIVSSQRIPRMTNPAKAPLAFIGCDVGKAAIVVFDSRDNRTQFIPNQPDALATFAKSPIPPALLCARQPEAMRQPCSPPWSRPVFPSIGPMPARSRRSSGLTAHWAKPTPSMPAPWPAMGRNAPQVWRAGSQRRLARPTPGSCADP